MLIEPHLKEIPEYLALAGGTLLIHDVIVKSEPLLQKVSLINPITAAGLVSGGMWNIMSGRSAEWASDVLGIAFAKEHDNIQAWLISIFLAYIAVKQGGMILEGGIKLSGWVGNMLGV